MEDFNAGKPLTARRILAVKAAIDAQGGAKARSAKIALETFTPEAKAAAPGMGFYSKELPKLARAVHFYMQASGLNEMDALHAVAERGAKAGRLMSYGGRFMKSAESFADGHRLLDTFAEWYADLCAGGAVIQKSAGYRGNRDYSTADTPSKLNDDTASTKPAVGAATEQIVFEHIAADPSVDLKEADGEKLFGFADNDASRFVCQNFGQACFNTIADIPPAKRAVVFKAFNLFCTLAGNVQEAKESPGNRMLPQGHSPIFLGRVLRHLDGIRDPLIAAIKQALPGGNAQKAVSIFLPQGSSRFVSFPQNHLPWPAGPGQEADVNAHALPSAEKPANRDKQSGP